MRAIADAIGFDAASLYQASQVHGARVLVADGAPAAALREEADALVAKREGAAVGVRVADCTPVLVADEASGAVAAIHAGWRGVVANVIDAAVKAMNAEPSRLVAAIGPCIGPCCFEVGEDVAAQIAGASDPSVVVHVHRPKAYVDMRRAARAQLRAAGLRDARVDDVPGCTKCGGEQFHSHRRDGDGAGRAIAIVVARARA